MRGEGGDMWLLVFQSTGGAEIGVGDEGGRGGYVVVGVPEYWVGRRLVWLMWGEGEKGGYVVGGCVNLLSDNQHQEE